MAEKLMEQLSQLSEDEVMCLLQQMPLEQQLRSSLVCRSWAGAVKRMPAHVNLSFEAAQSHSFQAWLDTNSHRVASLHVSPRVWDMDVRYSWAPKEIALKLHGFNLTQLTSLKLSDMKVVLEPAPQQKGRAGIADPQLDCGRSSSSSSSSSCCSPDNGATVSTFFPQLQRLYLTACSISWTGFTALQWATSLTRLTLREMMYTTDATNTAAAQGHDSFAVPAVLSKLPLLEELAVGACWMPGDSWWGGVKLSQEHPGCSLGSMQHLHRVSLEGQACSLSNLSALPTSLTALLLGSAGTRDRGLSMRKLACLTGLQELRIQGCGCGLELTTLLCCSQLQHLALKGVDILDDENSPDTAPAAALFTTLAQLKQLQHLELQSTGISSGGQALHETLEQSAAPAAFSQLTALIIKSMTSECEPLLAAAALQHVLAPDKQLPHLQLLVLHPAKYWISTANAECWARCCPALARLELTYRYAADAAAVLAPSFPLRTALRSLSIQEDYDDATATAAAVAQLTGLQVLQLGQYFETQTKLTLAGLQQLTALQGLTRLEFVSLALQVVVDDKDASDEWVHKVVLQASEEDGPGVWQQLQQCCEEARAKLAAPTV